jgi:hypothetical protein
VISRGEEVSWRGKGFQPATEIRVKFETFEAFEREGNVNLGAGFLFFF